MIKLIDIYIARTLFTTVALCLSVLIGLSSLLKFVDQLRNVGRGSYDMTVAGIYVLLSIPREIEQFFPMATLLGGLIGLGILASNSELVVMQSAGMSRFNIITSAMKSSILMVVFVMAISEWVAPVSEAKAKEIRTQAISGGSLFTSGRLDWAKDGNNFVSIGDVQSESELRDISVYVFDAEQELQQIIGAQSASFVNDVWQLKNVVYTRVTAQKIETRKVEQSQWRSTLTPDKLSVVAVKESALSIQGLFEYITYLENNAQDPQRYELALWRKLLQPITVAVMLLVALSFVFGPLRSVTLGARTIMGVLTGFTFFLSSEIFGSVTLVYQVPAIVGALLPSLVFAGFAFYLMNRRT